MKPSLRYWIFTSILTGLFFSLSGVFHACAQANQTGSSPRNIRIRYHLKEPPPTGNPPQTSGAGSRGEIGICPTVSTPLTALVPRVETPNGEFVWGRTTEARPTVWVYVPYTLSPKLVGEFRLRAQNASGKPVNVTIARVTQTSPGVIGLRLPPENALKTNQIYYWSFVVLCDPKDASANQFVKAAIQRIAPAPSLNNQLQIAKPSERAVIYANSGFWYDALTQLAGLRQANPTKALFLQDWNALLADIGLVNNDLQTIVQIPPTTQ